MPLARVVHFPSCGLRCEADLSLPDGFDPGGSYPALVLGHGFTIARTQLVEEARLFAEAGYVVLAIDYRNFGGSEGEPRHDLDPMAEVDDIRAAIDWLEAQPGVDPMRIGIWGTSFGGGIVTHVAAYDIRVRACVAQAPVLDGSYWFRSLSREAEFIDTRRYLVKERRRRFADPSAPTTYCPVAGSTPDGFTPMPPDPAMIADSTSWFEQTGEQIMHAAPEVTIASFDRIMQFDVVRAAAKIAPRAYCIVQLTGHDVYHPQISIQEAYRGAGEPKHMASIPIDQLDCYKPSGRALTIAAATEFYNRFLK